MAPLGRRLFFGQLAAYYYFRHFFWVCQIKINKNEENHVNWGLGGVFWG